MLSNFSDAQSINPSLARRWIEEMKLNERGPFVQIRWFCKDGRVLPPNRVGCGKRGGVQHGELDHRAASLRDAGYPVATLYADFSFLDIQRIVSSPRDFAALLLERYLVIKDEGWIFRKALFYRGALQAEDEAEGAERLLTAYLNDSSAYDRSYLLVREGARLLALDKDSALLNEVRAQATSLANSNHNFIPLRNKLHAFPEPSDVGRIRSYAGRLPKSNRATAISVRTLAEKLERVFSPTNLSLQGKIILNSLPPSSLRNELRKAIGTIDNPNSRTIDVFWALSDIIYYVRKHFNEQPTPFHKRSVLVYSLQAERTLFKKWSELEESGELKTRYDHLQFLLPILQAAYGSGLLSERTYKAAASTVNQISDTKDISLGAYLKELRYLARVSEWAAVEVNWEFWEGLEFMRAIEPEVDSYVGDRLHSSLLLAYSHVLEKLLSDASTRAGMQHQILRLSTSSGVRALNPGLARGVLSYYQESGSDIDMTNRIVLAQNTEATLPKVAGILTLREGNSLSHIQLLARNLGIPNAVVGEEALNKIQNLIGREVVLAVSPAGRVIIDEYDSKWDKYFGADDKISNAMIKPDLRRLDLDETDLIPLNKLDSDDSGRTVGPKAARLGELKQLFPEFVSDGLAIPFARFAEMLEQEYKPDSTLFEWIQGRYKVLAKLSPSSSQAILAKREFLANVKSRVRSTKLDPEMIQELRELFNESIGDPETTGVFIRSDTNVEDLAGFTGAGLNLTVPNVVGFQNILTSIKEVWASPFEERAYGWRQDRMTQPEHVYSSVLIQKTVPSDISGVLITSDLESGDRSFYTVAVNKGIGGAVNNESSESLVVDRESGQIKLLTEASTRTMRVALSTGGLKDLPLNKKERLLSAENIVSLNRIVARVEKYFSKLTNAEGQDAPADIEFGFYKGKLFLFQIRPFLESVLAKKNRYLIQMDSALRERYKDRVVLSASLFS